MSDVIGSSLSQQCFCFSYLFVPVLLCRGLLRRNQGAQGKALEFLIPRILARGRRIVPVFARDVMKACYDVRQRRSTSPPKPGRRQRRVSGRGNDGSSLVLDSRQDSSLRPGGSPGRAARANSDFDVRGVLHRHAPRRVLAFRFHTDSDWRRYSRECREGRRFQRRSGSPCISGRPLRVDPRGAPTAPRSVVQCQPRRRGTSGGNDQYRLGKALMFLNSPSFPVQDAQGFIPQDSEEITPHVGHGLKVVPVFRHADEGLL